jgi:hypothetical protein
VPANLKVMVDILVLETTRTEEGYVLLSLSSAFSIYLFFKEERVPALSTY